METVSCLKSRWAVWVLPQETPKAAEHLEQSFTGMSGQPWRSSWWAEQWEAAERTVPATPLDINYTYWTSACSFKPPVGDQAWHHFNSLNCDSDACLETALTGQSTEHVSLFSRLWVISFDILVGTRSAGALLIFSGRGKSSSCLAQCHEQLVKSALAVRGISLVALILVCKISLNTRQ